jgi:hypothetical protein
MGGSSWSDSHYSDRMEHRAATGAATFGHDADIRAGKVATAAHTSLDPKRVAGPSSPFAGKNIRECRDSTDHPTSNGVAVLLDVTGSMSRVPVTIQKKLVSLMGLLLRKSYLTDPSILIGGIGDATCDQVPMQLGQFESGIEIENDLTNLFLEGGGGGQQMESYELALYFLARKTAMDCFEKRQKRGYAILIGDEMAYPKVDRHKVKEIFADTLEADISLAEIVAEVQAKFDLYYILPNLTNYYSDKKIETFWRELLGQQFIKLDDPEGVSELIATLIGVGEGAADLALVADDLKDIGAETSVAESVSRAIAPVGKAKSEVASIKGTGLAAL